MPSCSSASHTKIAISHNYDRWANVQTGGEELCGGHELSSSMKHEYG